MGKIRIFDATLRDGSHAIAHQFTKENISTYCQIMDSAGMDAIIVGHGNGLGASSLQVGLSKLTDQEMLDTARSSLQTTKLGAYMIPGFGTIKDNLEPAITAGVDLFKIGCHCTEANITRQHIEYLCNKGKEVYGILMMYHMASKERILEEAQKMQSYGAKGVILMDSAGASTPEMVREVISLLTDNLNIQIGFHAHNNLGMAVANTYTAIQEGATIIDGTVRGLGAGAGNCQLEAMVALLQKEGIKTNAQLYPMMDASEQIVKKWWGVDKGIDDISIVNGVAGIFSAFKRHVVNASREFKVDPRDIIMELGRRKAVAGQEDMIVEIAQELQREKGKNDDAYYLSSLL